MISSRAELVAEAAITLLAERGMRGLTHRAVDEAAGLPTGSTSNLARTRAALLELALVRLTELEERHFAALDDLVLGPDSAAGPAGNASGLHSGAGKGPGGGTRAGHPVGLRRPMPLAEVSELAARLVYAELREDRRRTLARYELALEATRRPELRALYDARGKHFRRTAVALLAAAGSNDPERHGDRLVAFAEGLMFYALAGAGAEPGLDDLRTAVRDFLNGVLR